MKNLNYFVKLNFLSLILCLFSVKLSAQKTHNYIKNNTAMAEELSKEYGIPSAIILGIAFVETGGGASKGAKVYHNHFGIVGKNKVMKSRYKSFNSAKESYIAFCKLISGKKYYEKLKGNSDYTQWIEAIASAGYSTQPTEWKKRVTQIINTYKLASK